MISQMEQVELSPQTLQERLHSPPQIDQPFEAGDAPGTGPYSTGASLQQPPFHPTFNPSI